MARTAVTISSLGGATSSPTTDFDTTIDSTLVTNGVSLSNVGRLEEVVIRITNTHGDAHTVVFPAGDSYPPAFGSGHALTVSVPGTTGDIFVGPLESARFVNSDGSVHIDLETDHAGTLFVFRVDRKDAA